MDYSAVREVALDALPLAGLHHLALFTLLIIVWIRRRSIERLMAAYFTLAFTTVAYTLTPHAGTRVWGVASAALACLWLSEAVRTRGSYDLARSPRTRLVVMGAFGAFAVAYPGFSGGLPSFMFSPLGTTLPPTLIAATALLNAASPGTYRALHWSLAVAGLVVGIPGLAFEGWIHAPLVVVSAYAVPLLLGKGRLRDATEPARPASVEHIRDRMYARRTFLPGPSDPRRRRRSGRIRRR